CAGKEDSLDVW
nr:immunoglobulin heavy chain junction region [Macaca mulatta]MOV91696.1 immunoglobulin heavy chain junction region [Macaca mulatta]